MSTERTDLSISVRDENHFEWLMFFRACPDGVYVTMRGFPGFVMPPQDADAVEKWMRDERRLRQERTAEDCEAALRATETALSNVQDSDIALRLEEAMEKINEAKTLAEERNNA